MSRRKIEINYADEHQNVNEVFNEVFRFEYVDKKAKFEWNMYVYAEFVVIAVAVLLNFILPQYVNYILVIAIVTMLILYYVNNRKRLKLMETKRVYKVRLKNKDRNVTGYQTIKPANAHEIMKDQCLVIEVSVKDYYDEMHIKGAISIPLEVLSEEIDKMDLDKNATILVYSRGEERCKQGAQLLVDKGFTDVYEFGTIMNWPYEVELMENTEKA